MFPDEARKVAQTVSNENEIITFRGIRNANIFHIPNDADVRLTETNARKQRTADQSLLCFYRHMHFIVVEKSDRFVPS